MEWVHELLFSSALVCVVQPSWLGSLKIHCTTRSMLKAKDGRKLYWKQRIENKQGKERKRCRARRGEKLKIFLLLFNRFTLVDECRKTTWAVERDKVVNWSGEAGDTLRSLIGAHNTHDEIFQGYRWYNIHTFISAKTTKVEAALAAASAFGLQFAFLKKNLGLRLVKLTVSMSMTRMWQNAHILTFWK